MPKINVTAKKGLVQTAGSGGIFVEGLAGLGSLATDATETITINGAVPALSVTATVSNITTTGAESCTLPDGLVAGQLKCIWHNAGANLTVTPDNFADGTTITFTATLTSWYGIWSGSQWVTINLGYSTIA